MATINGTKDLDVLDGSMNRAMSNTIKADVLIVGAGPAGASLACFLSSHGITGLIVSMAAGTADTPRAHITNMAALECLLDVGLDKECYHLATKGDCMLHTRWCHSMAGEEYARIHSWGNDPKRRGDYEAASPCTPVDLPQTLLEPSLIRYAVKNGFKCLWNTSFVQFEDSADGVVTTLRENITNIEYNVHSKFLFGADGARSRIVKSLELPLYTQPGGGLAINVLVRADLSHLIEHRKGNLHWIMQPDRPHCSFGWMGIVRMVKPWHEWMFILFPKPGAEYQEPTPEEYLTQVKNFIGDDSVPAEILNVSKWNINEIVAEKYSSGNVYCLGDAVHRHPPFNGLGSNTCIQDAFNLAWKVAYVIKGLAAPSLLSTYSVERQPVGLGIVTRANNAFREHFNVWKAIGIMPDDIEVRMAILHDLRDATEKGREARKMFRESILQTAHEFHGLGVEMGQRYTGPAIIANDETEPFKLKGPAAEDPVFHYMANTFPGCRLPHAWLNTAIPGTPVSTIELSGKGRFTLFTGIGGDMWKKASIMVSEKLKVPIQAYGIGFRQDWEDVYFDWERLRGVKESGAVLVRPDRFIAWRTELTLDSEDACTQALLSVMCSILGL